ncbi:Metallo-dependent phosphatase [Anaeromyces robustus]|uniref:Metallo-dependent phosphatase n=1 Tax=Anaeromyces robustus TaxID=1754192 RepID=A0A1Y1XGF8_9FUNG|nr:Metallo-dependent phosphatase [Anaeromyces robustus]|eukprot:ORX84496.1 Metallo-dependent phosphatase [Anaeromyces robustus]
MRFSKNYVKNIFLFALNYIVLNKASPVITEEQLNSFKYGEDEFTLAVIGDSGSENSAKEVMKLSKFDILLHLGDFDYKCMPNKYFDEVLTSQRKFQFMGVLGNHDAKGECKDEIANQFLKNVYNKMTDSKNKETRCEFSESKFMWSCVYKNMKIIGLTPGINGADKREEQLKFLKEHLSGSDKDWKICAWHFYDKYFHTGKYQYYNNIISGEGESFYEYCKNHGAIIFSAHDHVYARTHVMSSFKDPTIDKYHDKTRDYIAQIRDGASINILNGTGGWEIYIEQGEQKDYPWWQKKYARGDYDENAKRFGGLFCRFNVDGNNRKASCVFKRINSSNEVFDKFYIYRNDNPDKISYHQIDDDFNNEKLKAFKIENNIIDTDEADNNDNVNTNDDNDKIDNNDNINTNDDTNKIDNNDNINTNYDNDNNNNNINNKTSTIIVDHSNLDEEISRDYSEKKVKYPLYKKCLIIGSGILVVLILISSITTITLKKKHIKLNNMIKSFLLKNNYPNIITTITTIKSIATADHKAEVKYIYNVASGNVASGKYGNIEKMFIQLLIKGNIVMRECNNNSIIITYSQNIFNGKNVVSLLNDNKYLGLTNNLIKMNQYSGNDDQY